MYTGVKRTPICAAIRHYVATVAAEWFATTHDVYVVLGMLSEDPADTATADGRPMTRRYAHARLARMLGGDGEITPEAETRRLAEIVYSEQCERISDAVEAVNHAYASSPLAYILSGSGEFLARESIRGERGERISLTERLGPEVSEAACASPWPS